jgi:hypothetical protein
MFPQHFDDMASNDAGENENSTAWITSREHTP